MATLPQPTKPRRDAPTPAVPRPRRTLLWLTVVSVLLLGSLLGGTQFSTATLTPKLALDLQGGTQIILTPRTTDGSEVSDDDINQAISIIRQRVDASGVAEAEITRQGQQNIVVALPGEPDQATLDLVRQSAQMRFRPVLGVSEPTALSETDALAQADADGDGVLSTEPASTPADNSDLAWITEQMLFDFYMLDCTDPALLHGGDLFDPADPAIACAAELDAKYLVGPAELEGSNVATAASGLRQNQFGTVSNEFAVSLSFDSEGTKAFGEATTRLVNLEAPRNQLAIVLDGRVVSAPTIQTEILDGRAEITGNFTQESAATLANQLSFGSLPLNFEVQSEEQISATLGIEQLEKGLLAGALGLALVVVYMLLQYRALGLVALASLAVAGGLSYLVITLLSWGAGYRLSLAGVTGLIVAIGITADSFIVYFERIRDEIREGRELQDAVESGWSRARRTILASDAVNFLAAAVLYFLAVGGVRGFAFTLGLTTLVDLVVVFMFTHPVMQLLIRTRFFGSGTRFSGLNPERLGVASVSYQGRGQFSTPKATKAPKKPSEGTIAERKAAQAAEADSEEVEV